MSKLMSERMRIQKYMSELLCEIKRIKNSMSKNVRNKQVIELI